MKWAEKLDTELMRLRIMLGLMLLGLMLLAGKMWHVQVVDASQYRTSLDRQSIRRVRIPGTRGTITDRNGILLAANRPSYCIAVYIEELRCPGPWTNTANRIDQVITSLAGQLGLTKNVTTNDIKIHMDRRMPLPFIAWRDVSQETLARLAESREVFDGVDVYVEAVRFYPLGDVAAHVLGYVGKAKPEAKSVASDEEEDDDTYHYYLPELHGRSGIETNFNDQLKGIPGGRLIRVNAAGVKFGEVGERLPLPGQNVMLTLDAEIQRLVERTLTNLVGAAVILDPRNGDVIAMASSPSFNPNWFCDGLSREEWTTITNNTDNPMLNRAIRGRYPPGSIFKPLVALAALENNLATEETPFDCAGAFYLGRWPTRCWLKTGHGTLNMRKALEQSCNCYFCQLGLKIGYEQIYRTAKAAGLGQRTGIELEPESAGNLPEKTREWRGGDTCNASIGQGAILTTPIQMALVVGAIANGGCIYRPRLVKLPNRTSGDIVNTTSWSARSLRTVRQGMYDVVQAETGTGKRARVPGVEVAGKTGTAEYGASGNGHNYAWMIAYAPYSQPRYALAIVVEDTVSGGSIVAPRVSEILRGIFALEARSSRPPSPLPLQNGRQG
jgi:penicillin-binding protein 2